MTRSIGLLALLPLLLSTAAAPPSETLDFDIVTNGVVNGTSRVELLPTGSITIGNRYQSQDKDRTLTVEVSVDAAGLPTSMRRSGQAFAFHPIDERFMTEGGRAVWRNRIENGNSARAAGRYYIPLGLSQAGDSAAYELGLLAAALLRAPGGRLELLPVGAAQASVVKETTVRAGERSVRVRLVAIRGLGMEPDYVWLDAANRLFAGRGTIRAGWREAAAQLDREVREADRASLADAVRRLNAEARLTDVVIHDVAVFDARQRRLLTHRTVRLSGGRIASIGPADTPIGAAGTHTIDGRGLTLLPGLWDMHVHMRPREALRHLASGVTTVRDLGNDNAALTELAKLIEAGSMPGPRVIKAGFLEALGPITTYTGTLVSNESEAVAAVDAYADAGYAQIKLYNAIRPEWVAAIAARAKARKLRLGGHIPMGGTVERATADGYDEIQHLIYPLLALGGMPAQSPLTFNAAKAAQAIDLTSPTVAAFINQLRDRDVALDMTLTVYEPLFLAEPGRPSPVFSQHADLLPPAMLRQVAQGPLPTPPGLTDVQFRAAYGKALALTKRFRHDGVRLIAGTDFAPLSGLALPRELELLVEAGLSPTESLRIATLEAAQLMGRDDTLGTIEVGKSADLVLVEGDPTRDISRVRRVRSVIKGGQVYDPRSLLKASGLGR